MKIRGVTVDGDIVRVPLTKGQYATIDLVDLHLVIGFNWCADQRGDLGFYAGRSTPRDEQGKQRFILMHRVIIDAPVGALVDHINGDGLDNRRANLRLASPSLNSHNRHAPVRNSSGYRGVCWSAHTGKWQAGIKTNGKSTHLGLFDYPEDAHAAYRAAAEGIYGSAA